MKRLAIALIALLATAGCQGPKPALTVGLTYIPNIQFAPFYVAEAKGYFKEEGLNVTLRHHGASESLLGALGNGQEQLVVAGSDEMLQGASNGVDVLTVGQLYQTYPVVAIVPEKSPIVAPKDLKGKKVGVPGPFGESWFGLLAILQANNLTQSDVTIEHIGYTVHSALTTGQVDAVVGFSNNDTENFRQAGFPVREFPVTGVPLQGIGIGASGQTARTSPKEVAAFLRAISRALDDIIADPRAAVELCFQHVPELKVSGDVEKTLATLKATIVLYGDGSLRLQKDHWPHMYDFLVAQGLAKSGFDPSRAVTDELLPAPKSVK